MNVHDWRDSFRVSADVTTPPLGPNETMRGRRRAGLADFPAGTYPACIKHGAMLRMTPGQPAIYRCDACGAAAEWSKPIGDAR